MMNLIFQTESIISSFQLLLLLVNVHKRLQWIPKEPKKGKSVADKHEFRHWNKQNQ